MPRSSHALNWTCFYFSVMQIVLPTASLLAAFPTSRSLAGTSGTLMILGGGKTRPEAYERFFEYAGGDQAHLIHIPTATESFEENLDKIGYYIEWTDRPKQSFRFVHTRSREEAQSPHFSLPLHAATGVWMGGGDQNNLANIYGGTPVCDALRGVLQRGGVVAGTSSGASIMSRHMLGEDHKDELWVSLGFSLCEQTIVDCHFTERQRFQRMVRALHEFPEQFGIGVDEQTVLILRNGNASVIGRGSVSFFHGGEGLTCRTCSLYSGETRSLAQLWTNAESIEIEPKRSIIPSRSRLAANKR